MRIRIALIVVFLSFVPLAYASQPPTSELLKTNKQGDEKSSQSNQIANQNKCGTEDKPLIVKMLPNVKSKADADYETYERHKKATNECRLTWATIWLAIVTTFLAFFTAYLWWSTRKLWKSTHAAFIATNRPRLRIRRIHSDGVTKTEILPTWVYITNIGGSTATDIILHAVFAVRTGNIRTAPWIENLSKSIWHDPSLLAPGEEKPYELRSKVDVIIDHDKIMTGEKNLLIIGTVRYRDANQTERETGFGWVYDPGTGEFSRPEKDDQYNYEH